MARYQYHLARPVGVGNPLVQPGEMAYYPAAAIPVGWIIADGSYYYPSQYPALYQAIGFRHGKDAQGRFRVLEVMDFMQPCNPSLGDVPFTVVPDDVRGHGQNGGTLGAGGRHNHTIVLDDWGGVYLPITGDPDNLIWGGTYGFSGDMTFTADGDHTHPVTASGGGGTETAPKHMTLVLCVCTLGDSLGYIA